MATIWHSSKSYMLVHVHAHYSADIIYSCNKTGSVDRFYRPFSLQSVAPAGFCICTMCEKLDMEIFALAVLAQDSWVKMIWYDSVQREQRRLPMPALLTVRMFFLWSHYKWNVQIALKPFIMANENDNFVADWRNTLLSDDSNFRLSLLLQCRDTIPNQRLNMHAFINFQIINYCIPWG